MFSKGRTYGTLFEEVGATVLEAKHHEGQFPSEALSSANLKVQNATGPGDSKNEGIVHFPLVC